MLMPTMNLHTIIINKQWLQNLLFLGRVSSGEGGEIIMEEAKKVIAKEFPEYANIQFRVPDEKFKRHGQAVVAASLPALAK